MATSTPQTARSAATPTGAPTGAQPAPDIPPGTERAAAPGPHGAAESTISRRLVIVLAISCGMVVANLYYAQPLLHQIAGSLHVSSGAVGLLITLGQIGYAAGLLFVVPLGDILERRRLIVVVLSVATVAMLGCAFAPNLGTLIALALLAGLTSVVAQILVPLAASLAGDAERGRVVGTVMSGLLMGILLARTVSGLLGQWLGWRAVYGVAAGLMVVLIVLLRAELPRTTPPSGLRYPALMASVWDLVRTEPVLRLRCVLGALGMAAFSIFWTTLDFLLSGPPYHYGDALIGAFGLAGAAGALVASRAGRGADGGHAKWLTVLFPLLIAVSFIPTLLGEHHLIPLLVGVVVLDLGVQGLQVTNQSQIYALAPQARSRITTAYMTSYFAGGALGSAGASVLWSSDGWAGVCIAGGACGLVASVLGLVGDRLPGLRTLAGSPA